MPNANTSANVSDTQRLIINQRRRGWGSEASLPESANAASAPRPEDRGPKARPSPDSRWRRRARQRPQLAIGTEVHHTCVGKMPNANTSANVSDAQRLIINQRRRGWGSDASLPESVNAQFQIVPPARRLLIATAIPLSRRPPPSGILHVCSLHIQGSRPAGTPQGGVLHPGRHPQRLNALPYPKVNHPFRPIPSRLAAHPTRIYHH